MDCNDRRGIVCAYVSTAILMGAPAVVHAAEWYLEPLLTVTGNYDDNRFLKTTNEVSVLSGRISPTLFFGRRTETLDMRGTGRVDGIITDDQTDPDRVEALARLFTNYQTQRGRWQLDASWRRETTLRTDIRDPAFDAVQAPGASDLQSPDLGLVTTTSFFFNRITVAPFAQWIIGPRTTVEFEYRFDFVGYEDKQEAAADPINLFNSMRHAVTPSLTYRLSPKTELSLIARYQRFDNDVDDFFNNYSAGLGIKHKFSENLMGTLTAGPTYTENDQGDDLGAVVDLGLEKQFEKSKLGGFFHYDIEPSTRGIPLQRAQFDVRWLGNITPRWSFAIAARAFRNDRLDDVTSSDNRYYAQLEPMITWQATRMLFLQAGYRLRWQRREDTKEDAFSNAVTVGVTYQWDRLSASR